MGVWSMLRIGRVGNPSWRNRAMHPAPAQPIPRPRLPVLSSPPAVIHLPPLKLDSPLDGGAISTESRCRGTASLKVPDLARTVSNDTASATFSVTNIVHPSGDAPRNFWCIGTLGPRYFYVIGTFGRYLYCLRILSRKVYVIVGRGIRFALL